MANGSSLRHGLPCSLLVTAVTILAMAAHCAVAMPAPTPPEVLLAVTNFDGDCHPDSLFGRAVDGDHYVPTRLVWGAFYDTTSHPPCPQSPAGRPAYAETTFEYPVWQDLRVSVSIEQVNTSDSVADLVFALWGRAAEAPAQDTLRRLCLFGGPGLDTVATIDLGTLPVSQLAPFAALDLAVGTHLVEPEERDMTGRPSYIQLPVDEPEPPQSRIEPSAAVPWDVKVYPNPVIGTTSVEGRPIPAGEYRVEVIGVDGSVVARRAVTVGADGDFFGTLDLRDLASSFYVLRIYSAERIVGDIPILKKK